MKILHCHVPIPLLEDLLTIANFREKESVLMENVAPGRFPTQEYVGSTNWIWEAIYNNIKTTVHEVGRVGRRQ